MWIYRFDLARRHAAPLMLVGLVLGSSIPARAQDAGSLLREQQRREELQRLDRLPAPDAVEQPVRSGIIGAERGQTLVIRNIRFTGKLDLLPEAERAKIASKAKGQRLGIIGIKGIADEVTILIQQRGRLLGYAILPPQDITAGTVTIQLMEGKLSKIEFERKSDVRIREEILNGLLHRSIVADSVEKDALEDALLRMNDLPGVTARARLAPGESQQSSRLIIGVEQMPRFTGITASNKTYDSDQVATLVLAGAVFNGKVSGDVLTVATAAGAFRDKNAANGKVVDITGLTLGGVDAGNYTLSSTTATTTADIAKAVISGISGITADNKTYDTTTSATLNTSSAGFTGRLGSDVLTVATGIGAFRDKNAAGGKVVDITGLTLGGADAGNYTLASTTATTTADIARAMITIAGITADNKTYDGTTDASLVMSGASFNGRLGSDVLTVATASGAFAGKDAGNGKTVDITGLSLGGADAGNYTLSATTASTTANILQRVLSLSGARVYDGTADVAAGILTLGNLVGGETLMLSGAGQLADKSAGIGRSFAHGTLVLGDGSGLAANYTLAGGATTVDIAKAVLTLSGFTADSKIYDGSTAAQILNAGTLSGTMAGDDVFFASTSAKFADKNAGIGKTVTLTGALRGADVANYLLAPGGTTTTADIGKAIITSISGIMALSKPYDGNSHAALVTSGAMFNGMVAGDLLRVASGTGNFADASSGTGKRVNITGLSLGGVDASNYILASSTATAIADINASVAPVLPPPNTINTGRPAIDGIGATERQSFVVSTYDTLAQPVLIDIVQLGRVTSGTQNRNSNQAASSDTDDQEN